MSKKYSWFIAFFITLTFYSCYYDHADILYASTNTCDTMSVVSYSKNVVPLLQQQCYGCHSSAASGGGVLMGNYAADKAIATNGSLYGSIAWTSGYSPMPKGAPKMTNCQLTTIKKWIDAGSPNN